MFTSDVHLCLTVRGTCTVVERREAIEKTDTLEKYLTKPSRGEAV